MLKATTPAQQDRSVSQTTTLPASPTGGRKIVVRDLVFKASIGAYRQERLAPQRIILNIEIEVVEPDDPYSENLEDVLCYHKLSTRIQTLLGEGHIVLVETLAERICDLAFTSPLTTAIKVRVEKPDALDNAAAVGVEIFRTKA